MIDKLLAIIAPHLCSGCGKTGTLLCINCKYDIISEPYGRCVSCNVPVGKNGICQTCKLPYQQAWCVGERSDVLQRLIGMYKFNNSYAAHRVLGELLDSTIPILPSDTVIVPVPTVSAHIRERGYDHTLLLARDFARCRHLPVRSVLDRQTKTKQRDAGRAQRIKQAKEAFICQRTLDPQKIYLVIDDVVTTGATMKYATQCLRDAGAQTVWVAVIARQPLD